MHAVIGSLRELDASSLLPFTGHEGCVLFGSEFTEDLFILREDGVVFGGIGQARAGCTEVFMLDGTDEDETHLTVRTGRGDEVHELEHFTTELRWAMVEAIAGWIGVQDGVVLAVGEFI